MTERAALLGEVSRRLGTRKLVWAGIRGDDIEPLADLPQLASSFSLAGAYNRRSSVTGVAYENISGVRVDPEIWDIDDHLHDEATIEFRQGLLRALAAHSALLPYRPSQFLSAIHFARRDRCLNLGLFAAQQSAFEHKPWVESSVADLGVPSLRWTYVADEEQLSAGELADHGPVILRRSRTSGGEGFIRAENADDLVRKWPHVDEAFVSVAPFLTDTVPVNIGATVWADGVTVHRPSVQLIGIPSCVTRPFGYCGNDFGMTRDLDPEIIEQVEESTQTIGMWLRTNGYLGTFGVDFLVHQGVPLFTEVNPRFQGSTHASARLSIGEGEACLLLEHIAARLGIACPKRRPLRTAVAETPELAHLVVHWTGTAQADLDVIKLADALLEIAPGGRADVMAGPGVRFDPGAAVVRFTLPQRITSGGFDLDSRVQDAIASWNSSQASRSLRTSTFG